MGKSIKTALNTNELKEFLTHVINNNKYLQEKGKMPVAINVESDAGIGKTSAIIQLAESLKLNFVKLNLSQLDEICDLTGYPIRQFQMCKKVAGIGVIQDECLWIDEPAVSTYEKEGYKFTGTKRMSYCPPEWIADKGENGILLLDDYSRAPNNFMQACMELTDRQSYMSWGLPKGWTVLLSTNPDDGNYFVTALDEAQKTRFATVNLKFDVACWAEWAEKNGIDGRAIYFLLNHPEVVEGTKDKTGVNPRSITTFFNSISSFDDFENNLPMIQLLGESSVGPEVSTLFTMFINNRLDKIISPKDILTKDWKIVKESLIDACGGAGKGKEYRPDIASIITTRIINYSLFHAEKNSVDQKMIDRIIAITTDEDLLAVDLKYIIIKELINKAKKKFEKLMLNGNIVKMTVK